MHSSLEPAQLIKIRKRVEDAFLYDFNMIIEEFDCYQELSSQLQSKVAKKLFGNFI